MKTGMSSNLLPKSKQGLGVISFQAGESDMGRNQIEIEIVALDDVVPVVAPVVTAPVRIAVGTI